MSGCCHDTHFPGEKAKLWLGIVFLATGHHCALRSAQLDLGWRVNSLPRREAALGREDSGTYDPVCLQLCLKYSTSSLWVYTGECRKGTAGRLWPGLMALNDWLEQ